MQQQGTAISLLAHGPQHPGHTQCFSCHGVLELGTTELACLLPERPRGWIAASDPLTCGLATAHGTHVTATAGWVVMLMMYVLLWASLTVVSAPANRMPAQARAGQGRARQGKP